MRRFETSLLVLALFASALGCDDAPATADKPPASTGTSSASSTSSGLNKQPAPPLLPMPALRPLARDERRVIVLIWDGLRPDSVDATSTPELARLRDERGVNFPNHHAVYPTFTMMNAAALATGTRSAIHGFYGNTEYQPGPSGHNARGSAVDYRQPFFSEDHAILQTLDVFYRKQGSALLRVDTLFELAHRKGLRTAAIGKAGPAFLIGYHEQSEQAVVLDENVVLPRSFATSLQAAGFALPKNTLQQSYPDGTLALKPDNGDPSAPTEPVVVTLADGVTPDPRTQSGSAHNQRNAYLMRVFLDFVLPKVDPELSMIWLRNPDSTEHIYGPGSPNVRDALRHQDQLLSELLHKLEHAGRLANTDVLIVSDHGHSTVASDAKLFPPRALDGAPDGHATLGGPATPGYAVSGEVRSAAWLRDAGFPHAYDGGGCVYDPVLSGVGANGAALYATQDDADCGKQPRFSTSKHAVPKDDPLPSDAIIIAANGGSEYFYLPSHDLALVKRLVTALQERKPYGALFARALYGELPGTLPLARIGLEGPQSISPPTPDLVASFAWDAQAITAAAPDAPGTEQASPNNYRGMHGSFSPIDVHNTLIAFGPDFRPGYVSEYPSSNLDVAPTLAALLGLTLPLAEGRVLDEALTSTHNPAVHHQVVPFAQSAAPATLTRVCEQNDLGCEHPGPAATYSFTLSGHTLTTADGKHYDYLDQAEVMRVQRPTHGRPAKH